MLAENLIENKTIKRWANSIRIIKTTKLRLIEMYKKWLFCRTFCYH